MLDKFYRDYKYIIDLENDLIGSIHSDSYLTISNCITNEVLKNIKCHHSEITALHKLNNKLIVIGTVDGLLKIINS